MLNTLKRKLTKKKIAKEDSSKDASGGSTSANSRLALKRGEKNKGLSKEMFALNISESRSTGLPSPVSCSHFDPIQGILAVGSARSVVIFGTVGVKRKGLCVVARGRYLEIFELLTFSRVFVRHFGSAISAIEHVPGSKFIFIGNENGGLNVVNIDKFYQSKYCVRSADWLSQLSEETMKEASGDLAVAALAVCPTNDNSLLVGLRCGVILDWSLTERQVKRSFRPRVGVGDAGLRSLAWEKDGDDFVGGYENGQLVLWKKKRDLPADFYFISAPSNGLKARNAYRKTLKGKSKVKLEPVGDEDDADDEDNDTDLSDDNRAPITSIHWSSCNGNSCFIVTGGQRMGNCCAQVSLVIMGKAVVPLVPQWFSDIDDGLGSVCSCHAAHVSPYAAHRGNFSSLILISTSGKVLIVDSHLNFMYNPASGFQLWSPTFISTVELSSAIVPVSCAVCDEHWPLNGGVPIQQQNADEQPQAISDLFCVAYEDNSVCLWAASSPPVLLSCLDVASTVGAPIVEVERHSVVSTSVAIFLVLSVTLRTGKTHVLLYSTRPLSKTTEAAQVIDLNSPAKLMGERRRSSDNLDAISGSAADGVDKVTESETAVSDTVAASVSAKVEQAAGSGYDSSGVLTEVASSQKDEKKTLNDCVTTASADVVSSSDSESMPLQFKLRARISGGVQQFAAHAESDALLLAVAAGDDAGSMLFSFLLEGDKPLFLACVCEMPTVEPVGEMCIAPFSRALYVATVNGKVWKNAQDPFSVWRTSSVSLQFCITADLPSRNVVCKMFAIEDAGSPKSSEWILVVGTRTLQLWSPPKVDADAPHDAMAEDDKATLEYELVTSSSPETPAVLTDAWLVSTEKDGPVCAVWDRDNALTLFSLAQLRRLFAHCFDSNEPIFVGETGFFACARSGGGFAVGSLFANRNGGDDARTLSEQQAGDQIRAFIPRELPEKPKSALKSFFLGSREEEQSALLYRTLAQRRSRSASLTHPGEKPVAAVVSNSDNRKELLGDPRSGEENAEQTLVQGDAAASSQMQKNVELMSENVEKAAQLEDKTSELAQESRDFQSNVQKLLEREQNKKWWQL